MPVTPESVLLVTPRVERDGGVSAHVRVSAEALAADGARVTVLAARVEPGDRLDGVELIQSERLFEPGAPVPDRLGPAAGLDFSVAHLHQVDDAEIVRALAARAAVVLSAHAYVACPSGFYYFAPGQECARGHGPGCWPNLLLRGCAHTRYPRTLPRKYLNAGRARQALLGADLVVGYSRAMDRHLAANGVRERAVVPLFPTLGAAPAAGHEARRRVVFAGRIVRSKGVEVLLRSAAEVQAEFVICGDGRELRQMRELAGQLGVQERVRFAGWLEPASLARELAEASVVAVPSLWPEPFGLVGIEALAAGRPVVASATGGIGEWLDDGLSGLLVAPGDAGALAQALGRLLDDPLLQARMGAAGAAAVAERYTVATHLRALRAAYADARAARAARM